MHNAIGMKRGLALAFAACCATFVSAAKAYTTSDYVQDNLVAMWDCSSGLDATGWTACYASDAGSHKFVWTGNRKDTITYSAIDGVRFFGYSDAYALLSSTDCNSTFLLAKDGTMEVVFTHEDFTNGNQCALQVGNNSGCQALFLWSGGRIRGDAYFTINYGEYTPQTAAIRTASFGYTNKKEQLANRYLDGAAIESPSSGSSFGNVNTGATLGNRNSLANPFTGRILAIRLYSSKLTAAQIAANAAIDRARFATSPVVIANADSDKGTVTGAGEYAVGSEITATAEPAFGYRFAGWFDDDGALVSALKQLKVTPIRTRHITAKFVATSQLDATTLYDRKSMIAMWDCSTNVDATGWTDVSGNYKFVWNAPDKMTYDATGVTFPGESDAYGVLSKTDTTATFKAATSAHLEISYITTTKGGFQLQTSTSGYPMVYDWANGDGIVFNSNAGTSTTPNLRSTYPSTMNELMTVSQYYDASYISHAGFVNGVQSPAVVYNTYYTSQSDGKTYLGNRQSLALPFGGKIMSIRLYKRELSAEEMRSSSFVDTARFCPTQAIIRVRSTDTARGTVSGGGTVAPGTSVTLTATPVAGCSFSRWQGDTDGLDTSSNPLVFNADTDRDIEAVFSQGFPPEIRDSYNGTDTNVEIGNTYERTVPASRTEDETKLFCTGWKLYEKTTAGGEFVYVRSSADTTVAGESRTLCKVTVTGQMKLDWEWADLGLTVTGVAGSTVAEVGSPTPDYGRTQELTLDAEYTAICPEMVNVSSTERWRLLGWKLYDADETLLKESTGETIANAVFTFNDDLKLVWQWKHEYLYEFSQGVNGTITSSIASGTWVAADAEFTLTAAADSGYQFYRWTGDGDGFDVFLPSVTATMSHARKLSADFVSDDLKFSYYTPAETTGSGSWTKTERWSDGVVPDTNAIVVIKKPLTEGVTCTVTVPNAITNAELRLGEGSGSGTVVLQMNHAKENVIAGDVIIRSGANLTHKYVGRESSSEIYKLNLTVGGNMTVEADAAVDVQGKGFIGARGDGYGDSWSSRGSSYGGRGSGNSGACSGSIFEPFNLGAGNSAYPYDSIYAGGGAVKLTVGGTLTVNGEINARPDSGGAHSYGSGGSIWLTAGSLAGSGQIDASGLACYHMSPGGGRIALYQTTAKNWSAWQGTVTTMNYWTGDSYKDNSTAGTIYRELPQDGKHGGEIIFKGRATTAGRYTDFPGNDGLDAYKNAKLVIDTGVQVFVSTNNRNNVAAGSVIKVRDIEFAGSQAVNNQLIVEGVTLQVRSTEHKKGSGWLYGNYKERTGKSIQLMSVTVTDPETSEETTHPGAIEWPSGLVILVK